MISLHDIDAATRQARAALHDPDGATAAASLLTATLLLCTAIGAAAQLIADAIRERGERP
jgi:hypothetical protein